jgi:transglutaminase-like putative cysteine protease
MKFNFACLVFLFFTTLLSAQKIEYTTLSIPDSLKQNANAVVRLDQTDIVIASQRSMNIKQKRVVTVLNEKGLRSIDAYEHYDKKTNVKSIQATAYDSFGNEIKKIKRKDFRDQSVTGGGTIFSDSRIVYLDYTSIQYPFTIVYESEVETSNTAFIPSWFPLNDYHLSVQKSILNVTFPNNLGFKKKESNFPGFNIKKTTESETQLSYTIENVMAQKREDYSPAFNLIYPNVKMGLEVFHIEGVDGTAKTWKEFGKWYSEAILTGTTELSPETKTKMKNLVGDETDPIKKAKVVYKYLQEKSRYVSIQVGIGGWKPMYATDVDRLGYGDCKALSNYTKALLAAVDVPSYNTLLYGDKDKMDIDSDFVSMQGNHMILCIPNKEENIFLECTSQVTPFGYQANFTDDRKVLIIKPEGGEIVRTKNYENKENSQMSIGNYTINENGDFSGKISIVSKGSQYEKSKTERMLPDEKEAHFKKYWSNINNLKINSTKFINDKENVAFTIESDISALNYGNLTSNKIMFAINAFNHSLWNVTRIRNRKKPFEIERGFFDSDTIEITLPSTFSLEFLPTTIESKSKFGEYKAEFIKKDAAHFTYKRSFLLKKGSYSKEEYEEYRLFMEQISRNDNAKIILTKI